MKDASTVQENNFVVRLLLAGSVLIVMNSVAKAMKVLRKLGCCLQIEVGMAVIKLFCLVTS